MKNKILNILKWLLHNPEFILMSLLMLVVAIIAYHAGEASVLAAAIIPGVAGGNHVTGEPLTTDLAREASPSLLLNEIDQQIVKIRPMATPIDQLSRHAGSKHAGSMIVDYYGVDTKDTTATLADDYDAPNTMTPGTSPKVYIHTDKDEIFDASDTILVQGIMGYESDGRTTSNHELVLYVTDRDSQNGLGVMAVNGKKIGDVEGCLPDIPADTTLIRMGRAASELDVMSPQFEAMPQKMQNYCQIFKMQVEQSTLQRLANKEVNWTMSDQEEAAIYDMRLGMENRSCSE